jgi:DUF1680 family protein
MKPPLRTTLPPESAPCWISPLRSANLLCDTFGPGKREIWPGHQIVEMGLAKLYRVTGDVRYLNLAKFMLVSRARSTSGLERSAQGADPAPRRRLQNVAAGETGPACEVR